MKKRVVERKDIKSADAPYSPGIVHGSLLFVSGQVPVDPKTGAIVSTDFEAQAEQVFKNMRVILEEAGSSMENVLKTTAFLIDMNDFGKLNEAYKKHFPTDRPARSCVEVCKLPFDARVEIEAIASV